MARWSALLFLAFASVTGTESRAPGVSYAIRIDPAHLDVAVITMRVEGVPAITRFAMKVHPEYDAKYWRYLDPITVNGTLDDRVARIERADSTLWRLRIPGGRGTIHYRVHIQAPAGAQRRAWMPFSRETGALINPPDFLLYLPDAVNAPARVSLDVPPAWRVATALAREGHEWLAPDAATLLDSPLLLGDWHTWSFVERGSTFHVVYWPLPDARPFDTVAFVDGFHRLSTAALDVFRQATGRDFWFLIQDGAGDALEHRTSVTIGVPSLDLARNPHAHITEIAHEFFHAWNLVVIHPDRYGELSFQPLTPTSGLWWGEGVTLHYADVLARRGGVADSLPPRVEHLRNLLQSYAGAWWRGTVSPERASLAFGTFPSLNPDATGGYYLQGELLANALDAAIEDSSHGARGLDDLMREMLRISAGGHGFTGAELERTASSVCGCDLRNFFATQVRGAAPIDLAPALRRVGLVASIDTAVATDDHAVPLPDLRIAPDFARAGPPVYLIVSPLSHWYGAGLRSGDRVVALQRTAATAPDSVNHVLRRLHIGDTAVVAVERDGQTVDIRVPVTSYLRPRVRFAEDPAATVEQRARLMRWARGASN
ncbi:MAG TPA: PDZ domain-containing protein [Gemmatimonadales bacterium]|jgi:predicted metalloprotease with PDZ domain